MMYIGKETDTVYMVKDTMEGYYLNQKGQPTIAILKNGLPNVVNLDKVWFSINYDDALYFITKANLNNPGFHVIVTVQLVVVEEVAVEVEEEIVSF